MLFMEQFKTYFMSMSVADRDDFAKRCGTSRAHLTNIAYDEKKTCGENLAMAIDQESGGVVRCEVMRPDLANRFGHLRGTKKAA